MYPIPVMCYYKNYLILFTIIKDIMEGKTFSMHHIFLATFVNLFIVRLNQTINVQQSQDLSY